MMYLYIRKYTLFILLLSVLSPNNNADQIAGEKLNMNTGYEIPSNCNYMNIGHKYSSNECSPIINDFDYTGLLINAPLIIDVSDDMVIPLASTYRHDINKPLNLSRSRGFHNSILFIVVNKESNELYSGSLPDMDHKIPPPKTRNSNNSESSNKVMPKKIVGGYVNVELVDLLRLPKRPAKYFVYATVENYKSNVLSIEVRSQDRK
jgi:hypothetical protein